MKLLSYQTFIHKNVHSKTFIYEKYVYKVNLVYVS